MEIRPAQDPVGSALTLGPALVGWSTTIGILWGPVCVGCDRYEPVSSPGAYQIPVTLDRVHPGQSTGARLADESVLAR